MGIFSRFTDIVNANITALLDKAEDPVKMVRLMIREMEETLFDVKASAARIVADQKTLERRLLELKDHSELWQGRAELAIERGEEDLARSALIEKSKIEKEHEGVHRQLDDLNQNLQKFREDIQTLEKKLDEAKSKKRAIEARAFTLESQSKIQKQIIKANSSDGAFHKFERMERDLDRLEGDLIAHRPEADLEEKFKKLEHEQSVEAELEALKEKVKAGKSD
ncbi:PspA/IM30 family protein [Pseudobacteriovorax antillogorgiicola]|uniref:Phage shock protein A (PspA) family protein n=1 Tax=Pseudobacteriovorax antillogorgiicola TaxID=1513793 RepID=A0A1Y6BZR1_9BACT|nr:PspA/IM30 family protein [Pseudobacteriovorax antillogorgiicola]TCS52397.1 phage shock protein A (PspA) family protein [Pseudobacteriovorax antillogorgiicola]SMF29041.1 phage shock protein A (PspA) family protein [Pseudobacteriovorax antillogorgiicola]